MKLFFASLLILLFFPMANELSERTELFVPTAPLLLPATVFSVPIATDCVPDTVFLRPRPTPSSPVTNSSVPIPIAFLPVTRAFVPYAIALVPLSVKSLIFKLSNASCSACFSASSFCLSASAFFASAISSGVGCNWLFSRSFASTAAVAWLMALCKASSLCFWSASAAKY